MSFQDLFTSPIAGLYNMPEKPKVLWYPSAGEDFRPNVFLTEYHIEFERTHHGRHFLKPDLFVFSCLGPEVNAVKSKILDTGVLFEDPNTRITCNNIQETGLNRTLLDLEVSPDYIDLETVDIPETGEEVFYFEIEISSDHCNYREKQKILYIDHENIDTFEKIMLNFFDVLYLLATREGCGMGGCRKSIIEHIYNDAFPQFHFDRGFHPEFLFLFNDFTRDLFVDAARNSDLTEIHEGYGQYILEDREPVFFDSTIYKVSYNH